MARLLDLARQYQQALDAAHGSVPDAAAVAAGSKLNQMANAATQPHEGGPVNYSALYPLILRTTLAASIVTHLERIPWAEVTLQMLREPAGTPLAAADGCAAMLVCLGLAAEQSADNGSRSSSTSPLPALLLRQVHVIPSVYGIV